jgi:hypothetical protein
MVSDELVATYASVTGTEPGEAARILEVRTMDRRLDGLLCFGEDEVDGV